MPNPPDEAHEWIDRRQLLGAFLVTSGAAAIGGGCASETPPPPLPPTPEKLPDNLNEDHFIIHNPKPLALEARRALMGAGLLTPVSRFFVRNNLPRPSDAIVENAAQWTLAVAGVAKPGALTLGALRAMPSETVTMVLQCSGNGRAFFEHGPSGSPWATGAAACVMWTGVRVRDVLARMGGPLAEARFLTSTGGEELPKDVEPDLVVVERSIPIDKALDDCLLAWELNGAPIPITHGGPLRLIVPGYFGCNHIKYVRQIAATTEESKAKIQATGYRFRPIGQKGSTDQPSMWRMPVKSWFNGPGESARPLWSGEHTFHGVAFSGNRGVVSVEVSWDGEHWEPAALSKAQLGANAWRTFQVTKRLTEGSYTIYARATDTAGDTQPEERRENERGYGHNGWRDHGLTFEVSKEEQPIASSHETASKHDAAPSTQAAREVTLSDAGSRGKEVFLHESQPSCGTCHSLQEAGAAGGVGPSLDTLQPNADQVVKAVKEGVGVMPSMESSLSDAQIADVATYVVEATRR